MSLLSDLTTLLTPLGISIETGIFTDTPPEKYLVFVPLGDEFGLHGDDRPEYDLPEVQISLYSKSTYTADKNHIIRALLNADLTITGRRYVGFEPDTGYHHYVIEVTNLYPTEDIT